MKLLVGLDEWFLVSVNTEAGVPHPCGRPRAWRIPLECRRPPLIGGERPAEKGAVERVGILETAV